jgi:mycothiol synthase
LHGPQSVSDREPRSLLPNPCTRAVLPPRRRRANVVETRPPDARRQGARPGCKDGSRAPGTGSFELRTWPSSVLGTARVERANGVASLWLRRRTIARPVRPPESISRPFPQRIVRPVDSTRYRLRDFLDQDFATRVDLSHRLNPELKYTEAELRRWDAILRTPSMVYRVFVIEERSTGTGVGFGELATDQDSLDPSVLWADVEVDPDHQHRGIGRHLADVLSAEARGLRTPNLWAMARIDRPRDIAFAGRQGFRELRRRWDSWLELPARGYGSIPDRTEALAREGIELTTLTEEGPDREDVRRRLLTLFNEAIADEPRVGSYTPATYERFVSMNLEGPGFLPEAFFLARKGDRYVGVSNLALLPGEPGVLHQIFTGTLREFRGHGIATELKRRTVAYAQEHGFRSIRTSNDSLNHPMWAINAKLGYQRRVEHAQFGKSLVPPTRVDTP